MSFSMELAERGLIPDSAIELGIRRLLRERLMEWERLSPEGQSVHVRRFIRELRNSPIAVNTREANEQHYELPPEFFQLALGKHLKYSSCYFAKGVTSLDKAEAEMLRRTCKHAGLRDGMQILELGCGWGSLTLWMAEHYPKAQITAVSNSADQRRFIQGQLRARDMRNVNVITCDMNEFTADAGRYDRVVSVEMFEHMRNIPALLKNISGWLKDDGRLFVHVFTHRDYPYFFETAGDDNWMGRYFFTGGMMPSDHLYFHLHDDLVVEQHWRISGTHYEKTARAWLDNMDNRRDEVLAILERTYGHDANRWFYRWRIFFMACAELWGYQDGREWWVSHYRFRKKS